MEIDEIRVGWTEIEIVRLRINEPETPELPQLETGSIRIAFTLPAGFRIGSWAKRVEVRQPGREPFAVDGIRMIGQFGDSIRVRGELPSVFGGKVVLQANLNAMADIANCLQLPIATGQVSAKVEFEVPLSKIAEPEFYSIQAKVKTTDVSIAEFTLDDSDVVFAVKHAAATASVNDVIIRDPHSSQVLSFDAAVNANLAAHGKVVPVLETKFSPNEELCELLDIETSGQVNVSDARFAKTNVGGVQLSWEANPNNLTIKSESGDFFGGSYGIEATMPDLDWTKTTVRGQFRDVQATRLVESSGRRLPISGVFSGGIELTEIGNINTAKGVAWATSRGFVVQRVPVEFSKCQLTWESGLAEFASEGTVSRGQFTAKASTNIRSLLEFAQSEEQQIEAVPLLLNAQLTNVPVMALREIWPFPAELRSLQGSLSTEVNRGVPMLDGRKICDVSCTLEDLQLNHIRLSDRIVSEISVRHDRANMTRLTGRLADGQLSGRAELSLSANPTGTFEIAANRMSLRRIGKAIAGDQDLSGSGTVAVRGRIGQQFSGRADLNLDRCVVGGVSVREAKFPVDWSTKTARCFT